MKRIAIVGKGGVGKSVLAKELGRRLGLPVVPLPVHLGDCRSSKDLDFSAVGEAADAPVRDRHG